ncbi:MAG: hypothetical protein A2X49_13320 [Lentisphaerae bacterium GWF2_52_8]|nr:MAG: hypothetical protein A2X49_13320 [Lentisphaerae bacterium GWF2_52_8]
MLPDYHTHTRLCKHATGEPIEYLRAAEAAGLSELGVSDHCPWPENFDPDYRMTPREYPAYRAIVDSLRKEKSKVKIRYGIEIDWVPGRMDEVTANIAGEDFDYLMGAVHNIEEFPFDNPDFAKDYTPEKTEWVWEKYAEEMISFIREVDFDIIAHVDLPKKFGFFPSSRQSFLDKMRTALSLAAEKGMAVEINTAGLRKPVRQIYPSLDLLQIAHDCGLALTLGSDAHAPAEVAANFKEATALARAAGYTHLAFYEQRKQRFLPLG